MVAEKLLRPILAKNVVQTFTELESYVHVALQKSRTTKLWVNCLIKPLFIWMQFVQTERECDWPLYLYAVEKMLPYCFLRLEMLTTPDTI